MKFARFSIGGVCVLLMLLCKLTCLLLRSHLKVLWVLLGIGYLNGCVARSPVLGVVDQEALKKFGG